MKCFNNIKNFIEITNIYTQLIKDNKITMYNFDEIEQILKNDNIENNQREYIKYICYTFIKNNYVYDIYNDGFLLSNKDIALRIRDYDKKYVKQVKKQYKKLRAIISPEQRSDEWFKLRDTCISASDMGRVLGKNKYEGKFSFLRDKVYGKKFETPFSCYWGKMFERASVLNYEYLNDVHLEDFGLLKHETYDFLGASPDSIISPYKRDMKTKTELVGRMIEIKCVTGRKLEFKGDVCGTVCPIYYWIQVMMQLECCDLEECDFIQYNIKKYKDKNDFINDSDEINYKSKKTNYEKSLLIEIVPNDKLEYIDDVVSDKCIYDYATHIYPDKIDISNEELFNWVDNKLNELKDYKYTNVIYYYVEDRNITLIKRNPLWFNDNFEEMKKMWNYVLTLRNNSIIKEQWKNYLDELLIKYDNDLNNFKTKDKTNKLLDNLLFDKLDDLISSIV